MLKVRVFKGNFVFLLSGFVCFWGLNNLCCSFLQAETGSDEVYAQVSLVPETEVRFRLVLIACMVLEKMRERRKLF